MPAAGLAPADELRHDRLRIAAFTRYGREAASTRQRLLQYIPALEAAGMDVRVEALLDDDYVRALATGQSVPAIEVIRSYAKRSRAILSARRADVIWIYAELFPYLPGWIERLAIGHRAPLVYDFDDAFFHTYDTSSRIPVRMLLGRKLQPIMRRAAACTCGNAYLQAYAARFCPQTLIVPTVVNTEVYTPRRERDPDRQLVIGWIGSPSTWPYVETVWPVLAGLAESRKVRLRIVGAGVRAEAKRFPGLDLIDWSESSEVADVQAMDIGIMPVPDEIWARGKSGYKLIQYMACGLPVVASPVGVNRDIVVDGETGVHATSLSEWHDALIRLIEDRGLRARFGSAGRVRAQDHYSLAVHGPRIVELFKSVARR